MSSSTKNLVIYDLTAIIAKENKLTEAAVSQGFQRVNIFTGNIWITLFGLALDKYKFFSIKISKAF